MRSEKEIKDFLKKIIDEIVEKIEAGYEVFYTRTDSIVETVYCLMLGGEINTVEEMKSAISKLLKTKCCVVEVA